MRTASTRRTKCIAALAVKPRSHRAAACGPQARDDPTSQAAQGTRAGRDAVQHIRRQRRARLARARGPRSSVFPRRVRPWVGAPMMPMNSTLIPVCSSLRLPPTSISTCICVCAGGANKVSLEGGTSRLQVAFAAPGASSRSRPSQCARSEKSSASQRIKTEKQVKAHRAADVVVRKEEVLLLVATIGLAHGHGLTAVLVREPHDHTRGRAD